MEQSFNTKGRGQQQGSRHLIPLEWVNRQGSCHLIPRGEGSAGKGTSVNTRGRGGQQAREQSFNIMGGCQDVSEQSFNMRERVNKEGSNHLI